MPPPITLFNQHFSFIPYIVLFLDFQILIKILIKTDQNLYPKIQEVQSRIITKCMDNRAVIIDLMSHLRETTITSLLRKMLRSLQEGLAVITTRGQ